jgi:hypothetical protein
MGCRTPAPDRAYQRPESDIGSLPIPYFTIFYLGDLRIFATVFNKVAKNKTMRGEIHYRTANSLSQIIKITAFYILLRNGDAAKACKMLKNVKNATL